MFGIGFQRILGADTALQQTFTDALGVAPPSYTEMKVKEAISALNNKRKERLLLLLEYIEDQGDLVTLTVERKPTLLQRIDASFDD